jgi:putative DNA methylase
MSTFSIISPKKLIEVAMPLDAINVACAYEKMPGIGAHPRGIHLWWARRPLAAAKAVIFGQLVHDPEDLWRCQNPGAEPNRQHRGHWTRERGRLFKIIEDLVKWENISNEEVLEAARVEIRRSWQIICELNKEHPQAAELFNPARMPGLHDPFAGGGAIPLEAQRLGLDAYASDLNPVAVLINKAMIEIPPRFAGRPPVHPDTRNDRALFSESWTGAEGLAEDVRRYGRWMRDEAEKRIGHLYPKVVVTKEMAHDRPDLKPYIGEELAVIAWLWTRTVKSPSPAFSHADVPLVSTFILSSNEGKEVYVQPIIQKDQLEFTIRVGKPPEDAKLGTSAGKRQGFRCLLSDAPMGYDYLRTEGKAGRMGQRLMAIVAEGTRGRVYLPPVAEHEQIACSARPTWRPDCELPKKHRNFQPPVYGMNYVGDIFTDRQLVALNTLCDLIGDARELIRKDAAASSFDDDSVPLSAGGIGSRAYAEAVSIYLAFAVDRTADFSNAVTRWVPGNQKVMNLFAKQAIGMVWDFPEANLLLDTVGGFVTVCEYQSECLTLVPAHGFGSSAQADAQSQRLSEDKIISTDPPYYDNIGYADLSDFFYVWLRRSLRAVYPELLATIAVPKAEELIATPHRHGSTDAAEQFFLEGMTQAMKGLARMASPCAPVTIYYAFKQSETGEAGTNSAGWETFLAAVLRAGFCISGTWPLRSEQAIRQVGMGTNALASSIVLVCRPRGASAGTISRRQFVRMLNESLPLALDAMTRESEGEHSPVAPVDLSQAIIGPGMAMFSRYEAVLEADGTPMSVKTALQLINRFLAEDDFDADTQFCLHWFEQHGWETGKFGEADTLARAKGTSVDGVRQSGVVEAGGGSVRLLRWMDYPTEWDARSDSRLPVWEALHQLIRAYQTEGDAGASTVLAAVASKAETARQLAYRLYTLCERKGWAEDARAYNEVVTGWSSIETAAAKIPGPSQGILFDSTKETP